jgi:hypothetical protein
MMGSQNESLDPKKNEGKVPQDGDKEPAKVKKLTEDGEQDAGVDDALAPDPKMDVPTPPEGTPEDEVEIEKEYVGNTEDIHFYLVGTDGDLQIVDQEGVMKYSAKDQNIDSQDPTEFIIRAINDVEVDQITRSIFTKYILPKLEEEEQEEEELDKELEEPKPEGEEKPKEEIEPEEEIGEKKSPTKCKKCGKKHWAFKPCKSKKVKEAKNLVEAMFSKQHGENVNETNEVGKYGRYEIKIENISTNELEQALKDIEGLSTKKLWDSFVQQIKAELADRKSKEKKDEGKVPQDKDSDQTKVKKLIEMKVNDGEHEFDVELVDDGTLDTVISINGREFRFDQEFTGMWRDREEGTLSDESLKELALDALANMEPEDYDELVAKGIEEPEPSDKDIKKELSQEKPVENKKDDKEPVKKLTECTPIKDSGYEFVEDLGDGLVILQKKEHPGDYEEWKVITEEESRSEPYPIEIGGKIYGFSGHMKERKKTAEGKVPQDGDKEPAKVKKLIEDQVPPEDEEDIENSFIEDDELQKEIDEAFDLGQEINEKEFKSKKTGKKLKAKAGVRSRGKVVFPAESPKVKDKKDHFPINSIGQARNALARSHQYGGKAPAWYNGSLSELQNAVERAVKTAYPSIEVSESLDKSKVNEPDELQIGLDKFKKMMGL